MFTLVQGLAKEVVPIYLSNKRQVKATKAAGGITFSSEEDAKNSARKYNYPGGEEVKARPLDHGFFSTKKVSGKHIYVPTRTL